MDKYCPRPKVQEASGRGACRVYTLDAKKAKGNSNLIAGMHYLHSQPLFVLFDCEASHSFISTKCV